MPNTNTQHTMMKCPVCDHEVSDSLALSIHFDAHRTKGGPDLLTYNLAKEHSLTIPQALEVQKRAIEGMQEVFGKGEMA